MTQTLLHSNIQLYLFRHVAQISPLVDRVACQCGLWPGVHLAWTCVSYVIDRRSASRICGRICACLFCCSDQQQTVLIVIQGAGMLHKMSHCEMTRKGLISSGTKQTINRYNLFTNST
jgi:hypothetical protein